MTMRSDHYEILVREDGWNGHYMAVAAMRHDDADKEKRWVIAYPGGWFTAPDFAIHSMRLMDAKIRTSIDPKKWL